MGDVIVSGVRSIHCDASTACVVGEGVGAVACVGDAGDDVGGGAEVVCCADSGAEVALGDWPVEGVIAAARGVTNVAYAAGGDEHIVGIKALADVHTTVSVGLDGIGSCGANAGSGPATIAS